MRRMTRGRAGAMTIAAVFAATWAWAQASPPLGLSRPDAESRFFESLYSGSPSIRQLGSAFRSLAPAAKAGAADAAFAWGKQFTGSAAFTSAYARNREDMKPTPPEFEGSVEDEMKRQTEKETQERAETMAILPPDQRAQMAEAFKQIEAMNKDPKMIELRRQSIAAQRAEAQQSYAENLKAWQDDYPADPAVLVARRLQHFLDVSADVDFDAKLVTVDGMQKFADPALERKSSEWRLLYRVGKEGITAARTQAQAWLKTLPPPE